MSDIQKIIEKIRKLQSLAHNNANINEAENAASLADRLIQEHRISQAQLEISGNTTNNDPLTHKFIHVGGRRTSWRETLMWAITEHYNCCWYISGANGKVVYNAVGRESDVAIVEYMFNYLEVELERLSKIHSKGKGVGFGVAFLMGAASSIRKKFLDLKVEMKQQASANNQVNALVCLENRYMQAREHQSKILGGNSKKAATIGKRTSNFDGFLAGVEAGKNVQINKALNKALNK